MSNEEYILGLDLGTKKVAALLGHSRNGQLSLCGVGLAAAEGMRRGEIVDLEKASASIAQAIRNLQTNAGSIAPQGNASSPRGRALAGVKIPHSIWVGITGDHIRCFNPHASISITRPGRAVTARDVEEVMREAVQSVSLPIGHEVIHVIARTFAVDALPGQTPSPKDGVPAKYSTLLRNSIANPVGMPASRLEVQAHVIAAASTALGLLERAVEQAGLAVEGVVLEPLASADAVLSEAERDLGVTLIDIGAGTTDIAIFVEGAICYTGALALGGSHVTRDLALGLEIELDEAETLKLASGAALTDTIGPEERVNIRPLSADVSRQIPRQMLVSIIQPRAVEMLSLAKEKMVNSGFFHRAATGAVLTGGGSQLIGLLPIAKQILGVPVRLGRPIARGPAELKNPSFATGVGLLLYGSHEQVAAPPVVSWPQVKPKLAARLAAWWKHLFGP